MAFNVSSTLPLILSVMDSPVVSTRSNYGRQQSRSADGAGWRDEYGTGGHNVLCESGLTAEVTLSVKS